MMKNKKKYISPKVTKISLDNTISAVMQTEMPPNPPPRGSGNKGSNPFESPFSDKPFG